jgi:glucose-6-phosphate 1-epimerase
MDLEVENLSDAPFLFEEALHTYLHIADVQCADVRGLESHSYIDKTDHLRIKTLGVDPLRIVSETDRVFTGATGTCILTDPVLARRILVKKEHSRTTVVWNPWVAKAAAMADFGDHEWPGMICIETANTAPDAITLAPGGRHTMHTLIEEAPL